MVQIDPQDRRGVWEGWGCSLAWWGHAVGGKRHQDLYADLFFTGKTVAFAGEQVPGLGMNIVRYNVGGGGNGEAPGAVTERAPDIQPWHRDINGYWVDPALADPASAGWDWNRDAGQRAMLAAAIARGADKVEFFSNAPMWWMMDSRSSAGGNLLDSRRGDFAVYLATVVAHAATRWNIRVDTVSPFNEPSAGWWNYPKNQEGCNIPREAQLEVIRRLRGELDKRQLQRVGITASDENSMAAALGTYDWIKTQAAGDKSPACSASTLINKVNVHSYNGLAPWTDNSKREELRAAVGGKRLWASEFGNPDPTGMVLARTIIDDINFLRPSAWIYWQALEPSSAWGLVNGNYAKDAADMDNGSPRKVQNTYYCMAQFTRFIRPGYEILGSDDRNSIIAYDPRRRGLVVLALNQGPARQITIDFSGFQSSTPSAAVTTSDARGTRRLSRSVLPVANRRVTLSAEPDSIHSVVIDGVTR